MRSDITVKCHLLFPSIVKVKTGLKLSNNVISSLHKYQQFQSFAHVKITVKNAPIKSTIFYTPPVKAPMQSQLRVENNLTKKTTNTQRPHLKHQHTVKQF